MMRARADVRRIRRTLCYTIPELAAALSVSVGTARRWVRDGMPLIDGERPRLVQGAEFLVWFKGRGLKRTVRCGPRQMYCCRCRDARTIMPGSAIVIHHNEKSASVKALCIQCGATMNRHCSRQNASEWLDPVRSSQGHKPRLLASPNTLVNDTPVTPPDAKAG